MDAQPVPAIRLPMAPIGEATSFITEVTAPNPDPSTRATTTLLLMLTPRRYAGRNTEGFLPSSGRNPSEGMTVYAVNWPTVPSAVQVVPDWYFT
ncbi:hypothetical protein GCM10027068_28930 [Prescottella soli]